MSESQGIIEFFAMSGLLHILAILVLLVVIVIVVVIAIYASSKSSSKREMVADGGVKQKVIETNSIKGQEFMRLASYYDPKLPQRACVSCASTIRKGKAVCAQCGALSVAQRSS